MPELKQKGLLNPSTMFKIKSNQIIENRGLRQPICLWNVEAANGIISACTSDATLYDIKLLTETVIVYSVQNTLLTCYRTKAKKRGGSGHKAA